MRLGIITITALSAAVLTASPAVADDHRVTICHATGSESNPYVVNTPAKASILNGQAHAAHQDPGDIIPPFEGFEGRNWDAAGQAIHTGGCVVPATDPVVPDPVVPDPVVPDPVTPDPVTPDPVVPDPDVFIPTPVTPPFEVPPHGEPNPLPVEQEVPVISTEVSTGAPGSHVAPQAPAAGAAAPVRNEGLNVQTGARSELADTGVSGNVALGGLALALIAAGAGAVRVFRA